MSKERLEEIGKKATGILSMDSGEVDSVDLPLLDFNWLYKYAKEQAERFEVLSEQHDEALKQNKRYREVIQESNVIFAEAIESIDEDEEVNGLEYGIKITSEALEESE